MSFELIIASTSITAALLFYTLGVFAERRAGSLKLFHLICFWLGLVCDTTGTTIMTNIAKTSPLAESGINVHGITGALAIILMIIHASWATWVYFKGSDKSHKSFHQFSTMVWLVWLVPYIIGMLIGIPVFHLRAVCAIGSALIVVAIIAWAVLRKPKTKQ